MFMDITVYNLKIIFSTGSKNKNQIQNLTQVGQNEDTRDFRPSRKLFKNQIDA